MVSLTPCPFTRFATRNSLTDSVTLLSLPCFCAFNPKISAKTCVSLASRRSLLTVRRSGELGPGFLEVKQKKKGSSCSWCGGFLRRCKKGNMGWDSDGTKNLEAEILEFMKNSEKPGMFPTKKDLIRAGRFDLVEGILNQGGWLAMGWGMDEEEEEGGTKGKIWVQENGNVRDGDLGIEEKLQHDYPKERNGAWSPGNVDVALNLSSSSLPSASGTPL